MATTNHLSGRAHPEHAVTGFVQQRKERAGKIVRFGRQFGDHTITPTTGSLSRDLTLGFFLRMGVKAAKEHCSHRTPVPDGAAGDSPGAEHA